MYAFHYCVTPNSLTRKTQGGLLVNAVPVPHSKMWPTLSPCIVHRPPCKNAMEYHLNICRHQ